MRKIVLFTTWLTLIAAATGGVASYLNHQAENRKELVDFRKATALLNDQKGQEALVLITPYANTLSSTLPEGADWLPLFVKAHTETGNVSELLALYKRYPRGFDEDEDAVLALATALVTQKKTEDFSRLRDRWANKVSNEPAWFALEVDTLLIEGKRDEAYTLLHSRTFEGSEDSGRLIRLALLEAKDNLREAWNILSEAQEKDPENTDVTTYRAQILEALKKPSLARLEYLSALQKDPNNPALLFQLGEFYRRNGHYELAVNTWTQGLSLPHSEELWIATLFWSRMTSIPKKHIEAPLPKESELASFVSYLYNIPHTQFWDQIAFESLPNTGSILKTRQETFWLRLADALLNDNESLAADILDFNNFHANSWSPVLQGALEQILSYRRHGILHVDVVAPAQPTRTQNAQEDEEEPETGPHSFFSTLQSLAQKSPAGLPADDLPDDIQTLLGSKLAYPAAFLADGWLEAALTFPLPKIVPQEFPEWVAFAYTQALRYNRGDGEALKFAARQDSTPALALLKGELMIATGHANEGVETLKPLARRRDSIGLRAAWLVSLVDLDRKDYASARTMVLRHPQLSQHVVGKETLARIALQQGDIVTADSLYGAIESESIEAKFYLARRAFSEKKWNKALKLTEQLVIEYPDNAQLQKDLQQLRQITQTEY